MAKKELQTFRYDLYVYAAVDEAAMTPHDREVFYSGEAPDPRSPTFSPYRKFKHLYSEPAGTTARDGSGKPRNRRAIETFIAEKKIQKPHHFTFRTSACVQVGGPPAPKTRRFAGAGHTCYACGRPATYKMALPVTARGLYHCVDHGPFDPTPIKHPLTIEEFRARVVDGRLRVVFAVELGRLTGSGGTDGLNEIVDEEVWDGMPPLGDISYRVVGVDPNANEVHILVDADAAEVLDALDQEDD